MFQLFNLIGLISFAFSGAVKGIQKRMDVFGIAVLGISTALGGGAVRDILAGEEPLILNREFYASCAFAGSLLFWALTKLQFSGSLVSGISMLTVFLLRVAAIKYNWRLPKFSYDSEK